MCEGNLCGASSSLANYFHFSCAGIDVGTFLAFLAQSIHNSWFTLKQFQQQGPQNVAPINIFIIRIARCYHIRFELCFGNGALRMSTFRNCCLLLIFSFYYSFSPELSSKCNCFIIYDQSIRPNMGQYILRLLCVGHGIKIAERT